MSGYVDRWVGLPKFVTLAERVWELKREHGSLWKAEEATGVPAGTLSAIRSGRVKAPGDKIITALGLKKPSYYERIDDKGCKQ